MRLFCLCFVLLVASSPARAQKEFNVWVCNYIPSLPGQVGPTGDRATLLSFGDNGPQQPAGICNVGGAIGNASVGTRSKSAISDAAGHLLLYSDGIHLYDRRQQIVPGGFRLNDAGPLAQFLDIWHYATYQSCAFAPGPDGYYYLFYWDRASEGGEVAYRPWYAIVDLRLNGGCGAVVQKQSLPHTFSPNMTVVRHRNNRDFWFLTRDLDSRGFRAYLLDKKGVNAAPVVSLAGVARYPNGDDLKAAPNGRRLVSGACNSTAVGVMSCVCVYDFDNATGEVTNELLVRQKGTAVYRGGGTSHATDFLDIGSASFSPDSRLLYSTEEYPNPTTRRISDLWQYDLTQPTLAAIANSRFLVSNVPMPNVNEHFFCGSLQLSPDQTLWATQSNLSLVVNPLTGYYYPFSAPIVCHPNVAGAGCGFELNGYTYPVLHIPWLGFPNVITNMLYAPPTLNYAVGCAEDSVQFWASSAGLPAGLRWDFGDPTSGPANAASGSQVAHRYARSGSYPVRLRLADGRVLTQTVTVAAQAVDFTEANVFTPNHDGLNDAFVPVQGALPGGRLRVFSRWGILVFGTAEADRLRWDGAGAAAGEYFYQLEYPDCQGRPRQRRGVVTLVR